MVRLCSGETDVSLRKKDSYFRCLLGCMSSLHAQLIYADICSITKVMATHIANIYLKNKHIAREYNLEI
ncbi:hypothetical protein APHDU1_0007 [Anaplasma phagocytophilum]|uniref:Uncharacterized protein n=3 Tax=Anaplasma phagocytophilum TaxID=948 RepID=Q2GK03_ANAPZ|nr:hypothetical protein APH_0717 [Anaplasma phagocytophilum str. HZ]AGR79445.1 hypothetical protein YYU_03385 [Anaplasma phagocytophilum str. HZ2]AGR80693.1 hypothetical protein WSQ_03380 [Anaplasma phagocytophilum str. JM]AGR81947.1 hypothetical protein YYY_03375 [Anaplasma phagocytophilum str. Dog2]EOA61022.1 hypothetical protein HGE1_03152 [Anaplasma phagocytophilum str. HGE1]KDB56248.1 hypothetical protein O997_03420 [Anaplasma phagocytophilum str. MRK]KKA00360.1 hypothetical protein APHD